LLLRNVSSLGEVQKDPQTYILKILDFGLKVIPDSRLVESWPIGKDPPIIFSSWIVQQVVSKLHI